LITDVKIKKGVDTGGNRYAHKEKKKLADTGRAAEEWTPKARIWGI
jgi:hypothetical protein